MKTAVSPKRQGQFGGERMEANRRPLMLKDFLRDTSSPDDSKNRRRRQRKSNESPTTVRYLLEVDTKSAKRTRKGTGVMPSKSASTTLSALHKASELFVKLFPFPMRTPSQKRRGTTVVRRQNVNKLSSILRRVGSMRESHASKASLPRRISAAMRSLSRREPCLKREADRQVRVRDIVRWRSFGDEQEFTYLQCHNSKTPPREESCTIDGTSDSCCSSRTSSCTWSESDSLSNLQSSCGSIECSGIADALNSKMLLLSYHREFEDKASLDGEFQKSSHTQTPTDTPIQSVGFNRAVGMKEASDLLDAADSCCSSGQEADVQQLEHVNDGCTICCDIEGYEEKEQFSPVSVLDFPFEDEDEAATSFEQSLANIERKKQQLLQKIGRYESLAKLGPVDLEERFALSEFELLDEDAESFDDYYNGNDVEENVEYIREIIIEYLDETTKRKWLPFESLVIDVFKEELSVGCELEEDELLGIAVGRIKEWLVKTNSVDESREFCLKETERNQDWRKFGMDEEEMAAEMEVDILRSLVDDLLIDLMD